MASSSFSPAAPQVFNGEGYHIWVVKMKTYLQAYDLWEVVNSDVEPEPLRGNPTVAQIRQHADERTKRHKAMSCIQNSVSDVIFTRIMAYESPKQAWDKLQEEFQGTERTRRRILEFEERFREFKDEGRRKRQAIFGGLWQEGTRDKPKNDLCEKRRSNLQALVEGWSSEEKSWFNPDAVCQHCKKKGHVERVCKSKTKSRQNQSQQMKAEARVAKEDSDQEEQVFAVSCSAAQERLSSGWLLDSGCTNHMTPDAAIFKSLDRNCRTKVKIGNGHFIQAEGKGDVLICTPTGAKMISNVLWCSN
ncbi:uncharacterized protein LOC128039909 [Gossypium raimondii]|uniref:uncharacterized protein LOC128039909 n=1 Tax=Gossypium raimondii TaxID=29730 RepID=UPI00227B146F|nr:uncharacterized protein LOC128039909 [Gossypium raimondii]